MNRQRISGFSVVVVFVLAGVVFGEPGVISDPGEIVEDAELVYRAEMAMGLFEALADRDYERFRGLLNSGADPNAVLPEPVPEAFADRFQEGLLSYYVRRERGFSVLMFASALGDLVAVRYLLIAGADRHQLSTKHKTFALYLAAKQGHLEVMRELMGVGPDSPASRYRIHVSLTAQRATLWDGDMVALSTEISSGKPAKPTPTGRYLVTNKYRHWTSTIYDAKMPYFLRLSCGDFGLHAGRIPGYPASSGCIRLPESQAKAMFAAVPVGTLVEIE